ncbi:MAG: 6-bladed beta-propeller [Bacteroidota bacterium]
MIRELLLTLLGVAVFFAGCSRRPEGTYKGPEPPPELVKTIKNARSVTEVYHQLKVIALHMPDTVFVGDIRDMIVNRLGQIAIVDEANRTPVVFDSSGNFVFFIGRYGAGPGECRRATSVAYNERTKQWIVADGASHLVLLFDHSGKFLSSFRVPSSVYQIYCDESGHIYLFMPARRVDYLVEERDYTGRFITGFFSPTTILKKLPFVLKGGSICGDGARVFVAHYISSSVGVFDSAGQLNSRFPLEGLANYIPPDESRIYEPPLKFVSSFSGVTRLFIAPYGMLGVQYSRMKSARESATGRLEMSDIWLALFRQDGIPLGQGIRSVRFLAADSYGRLYSVIEPSSLNENAKVVVWALRHFH